MKRRQRLISLSLVVFLSACAGSPRTQFFTLVAVPPQQTPQHAFTDRVVQIAAVHVPAVLDRPQRVVARAAGRLDILEEQQWGAPFDDIVRRALSEDLAARLPPGVVLPPDAPAASHTAAVVVDIQEFQPEPDGLALLEASWMVLGGHSAGSQRGAGRFTLPAGSGADSQVRAMSELLAHLADAIVVTLRDTFATNGRYGGGKSGRRGAPEGAEGHRS